MPPPRRNNAAAPPPPQGRNHRRSNAAVPSQLKQCRRTAATMPPPQLITTLAHSLCCRSHSPAAPGTTASRQTPRRRRRAPWATTDAAAPPPQRRHTAVVSPPCHGRVPYRDRRVAAAHPYPTSPFHRVQRRRRRPREPPVATRQRQLQWARSSIVQPNAPGKAGRRRISLPRPWGGAPPRPPAARASPAVAAAVVYPLSRETEGRAAAGVVGHQHAHAHCYGLDVNVRGYRWPPSTPESYRQCVCACVCMCVWCHTVTGVSRCACVCVWGGDRQARGREWPRTIEAWTPEQLCAATTGVGAHNCCAGSPAVCAQRTFRGRSRAGGAGCALRHDDRSQRSCCAQVVEQRY